MLAKDKFLTEQIITYLGNKRMLLDFIGEAVESVQTDLNKSKLDILDLFSGSGIVSRYFKRYSNELYVNDLEDYCYTINKCYLTNVEDIDLFLLEKRYKFLEENLIDERLKEGFISELYSPKNDNDIQLNERVFYSSRNAKYIDTCRQTLNQVPEPYKTLFLGPLLYEASTKNNTSGVFKGFYKNTLTNKGQFGGNGENALKRILSPIKIEKPILSAYSCKVHIFQEDANKLANRLPHLDLAYLDPPYNQHPYSSNYFMLNLINNYVKPNDISAVSGIPKNWNKSLYNKKSEALKNLEKIVSTLNASYIAISFNSDGFISYDEMVFMLMKYGNVKVFEHKYNVFRGCRNLNKRSIHIKEYLFLLKKE
ncbi:MAG: DNA adenine methylase [Bacilli bacterium]